MMVVCFLAAIAAMAYGYEHLSLVLFGAGLIIGAAETSRDQRARRTRETHRQLMEEVRRHR